MVRLFKINLVKHLKWKEKRKPDVVHNEAERWDCTDCQSQWDAWQKQLTSYMPGWIAERARESRRHRLIGASSHSDLIYRVQQRVSPKVNRE